MAGLSLALHFWVLLNIFYYKLHHHMYLSALRLFLFGFSFFELFRKKLPGKGLPSKGFGHVSTFLYIKSGSPLGPSLSVHTGSSLLLVGISENSRKKSILNLSSENKHT